MLDKNNIEAIIETALRKKLDNYKAETDHKPFHARLLGKDRLALFSFIQSVNTTLGMRVFEQVAAEIARGSGLFSDVDTQYKIEGKMTSAAQQSVARIMNALTENGEPNNADEIAKLKKVCQSGNEVSKKLTRADVYLKSNRGKIFLIDVKTAKPNSNEVEKYKQTMLEWVAATLYENPNAQIQPLIAIPYNPYHPEKYNRWTLRGMLDLDHQLKVAEAFWNFLAGGQDIYEDLLDCFARVGDKMRQDIDDYCKEIARK